jgi:hypothetical protein
MHTSASMSTKLRSSKFFARAADVVAVAAGAVAHDLVAVGGKAHLAGLEGLDHPVLLGHPADPLVAFDAHCRSS